MTNDVIETGASEDPPDEVEASRAPLLDHLLELRQRLVAVLIAIGAGFIVCFIFAPQIYNVLLGPFEREAREIAITRENTAIERAMVDLDGVSGLPGLQARIARVAASAAEGRVIYGQGLDFAAWGEDATLPQASDLDIAAPGRPIVIDLADGETRLANTIAMREVTMDLYAVVELLNAGGADIIEATADGAPTGVFAGVSRGFLDGIVPTEAGERRLTEAELRLIFTAPLEFFFVKLKLALFGAVILCFPFIAYQVYKFVAPGLYKNEKLAFLPFMVAAPVLFTMGGALVYYFILPFVLSFALGQEQVTGAGAAIELLPRVSEYLTLVTTLILAFGFSFQLPVVLTLLGWVGIVSSEQLVGFRRYAIVATFAFAAFLTPPDPISQIGLGVAILLLYELSILIVRMVERRREAEEAEAGAA